jgi:hypothetical protein
LREGVYDGGRRNGELGETGEDGTPVRTEERTSLTAIKADAARHGGVEGHGVSGADVLHRFASGANDSSDLVSENLGRLVQRHASIEKVQVGRADSTRHDVDQNVAGPKRRERLLLEAQVVDPVPYGGEGVRGKTRGGERSGSGGGAPSGHSTPPQGDRKATATQRPRIRALSGIG